MKSQGISFQTKSGHPVDVVILLAFKGLNHAFCVFIVFTEELWPKMIHLLSNKTTPHFQLLPISKVDKF